LRLRFRLVSNRPASSISRLGWTWGVGPLVMARGPDPSFLAVALFVQQLPVFHAVVDRLQDFPDGQLVFSTDLLGRQCVLPYRLAVQHFGTDAPEDEQLSVVRTAAFGL